MQHHQLQQQQQQHVQHQGLPAQLHPFQQQQQQMSAAPSNAAAGGGNYSSQFYKGLSVQADNFQQVTIRKRRFRGSCLLLLLAHSVSRCYFQVN